MRVAPGTISRSNSNRFSSSSKFCVEKPVTLPPGRARLGNCSDSQRIGDRAHDDRDRGGGALGGEYGWRAPGDDDIDRQRGQFRGELLIAQIVVASPSFLEPDAFAVDPSKVAQAPLELVDRTQRAGREDADSPHLHGLATGSPSRNAVRRDAATQHCDQPPPLHSIPPPKERWHAIVGELKSAGAPIRKRRLRRHSKR